MDRASLGAHRREIAGGAQALITLQARLCLDGQAHAALGAACLDDPAPIAGGHAVQKAMHAKPWNPLRLIRSFHAFAAAEYYANRESPRLLYLYP